MPRKMRWNCDEGGPGKNCFNAKKRLKFAVFDDCFPRRINFTDVDGMVEVGHRFCMLEWKGDGGSIRRGQHLFFERFTAGTGNAVLVVHGDAKDMSVRAFGYYLGGAYHEAKAATLDDLKTWLRGWVLYADGPKVAAG